jgi:hypothetical protein
MPVRTFQCSCQKCGGTFEFTDTYEKFNEFMNSNKFSCPNGHTEAQSPRTFLKVITMSESKAITDWKPREGRNYVDILNFQTARINGIQVEHMGSGLYIDRRTRKKYDYEEDSTGERHYFEVIARLASSRSL